MDFTMSVDMDNAAFEDAPEAELSHILREAARRIEDGLTSGKVFDTNGNKVGKWSINI